MRAIDPAWMRDLPRTVSRALPRSIRRAVAGVRRPLRRDERAVLFYFGDVAPARRHAHRCFGESLHAANIARLASEGQSGR